MAKAEKKGKKLGILPIEKENNRRNRNEEERSSKLRLGQSFVSRQRIKNVSKSKAKS